MQAHRALFVLPSVITVASFCCGLLSIHLSTAGDGPAAVALAGVLIFASIFFDMFDGLVARLTHTQSAFGAELDSISDVVAFGVAPAFLAYRAGLTTLSGGLLVAGGYAICGAVRLARFNVLSARGSTDPRFYLGLSIPMASSLIAALAITRYRLGQAWALPPLGWAALVVTLALLMVAPVHYRSFKKLHPTARGLIAATAVVLGLAAIAVAASLEIAGVAALLGYVCSGPGEAALRRVGGRQARP